MVGVLVADAVGVPVAVDVVVDVMVRVAEAVCVLLGVGVRVLVDCIGPLVEVAAGG